MIKLNYDFIGVTKVKQVGCIEALCNNFSQFLSVCIISNECYLFGKNIWCTKYLIIYRGK